MTREDARELSADSDSRDEDGPRPPNGFRFVDLRACKDEIAHLLPQGHPLREALLREPDEVPWSEGIAKLETYLRLAKVLQLTERR